jgi:hypothetical protein
MHDSADAVRQTGCHNPAQVAQRHTSMRRQIGVMKEHRQLIGRCQ